MIERTLALQTITFENGNRAKAVTVSPEEIGDVILDALGIPKPKSLISIIGGAGGIDQMDDASRSHLVQLISRGVARAAIEVGAAVIDGGTQSGVMAMIGQGVADRGRRTSLVGVAPRGKVTFPGGPAAGSIADGAPLDPNHSHFVLVESAEWGGEVETLGAVAKALSREVPDLTILVNGGETAKVELLNAVRNRWAILLLEGSGRLADEIAGLKKNYDAARKARSQPSGAKTELPFIQDPVLAEIVEDGEIHLFSVNGSPAELQLVVTRLLGGGDTLQLAWERFALYDHNAKNQQRFFFRVQDWILRLGVIATLLALIQNTIKTSVQLAAFMPLVEPLRAIIIIAPITLATLIAVSSKFNYGSKYILLRAAAESIKGQIFSYRARAAQYSDLRVTAATREMILEQKAESISRELMQSEVKDSALKTYKGPVPPLMFAAEAPDDGYSFLSPERYIEVRLGDQIRFHTRKVERLSRQLHRTQWAIYLFGGLGTFLAAIGLELWIAGTISLVGALTTYLQYQQVEFTLSRNNQTLAELGNLQAWWSALMTEEQAKQENIDRLVDTTERVLDEQSAAWVGKMRDALAELRKQQEKDREKYVADAKREGKSILGGR
ncbi:MAG: DUF4231 domain-containing protein [Chloroflexi bacterium]|nr:DUF4231 domain-containing protein [Chloroflexota bacterium]